MRGVAREAPSAVTAPLRGEPRGGGAGPGGGGCGGGDGGCGGVAAVVEMLVVVMVAVAAVAQPSPAQPTMVAWEMAVSHGEG